MKRFLAAVGIIVCIVGSVAGVRKIRGAPTVVTYEPGKIRGNPNARVTIIEFSDFLCPHCKEEEPILKRLLQKYPNDLKLVFKHSPLGYASSNSDVAAEASECAAEQNRFWDYHDLLFDDSPNWGKTSKDHAPFLAMARQLNLDLKSFAACLDSGRTKAIVKMNDEEGSRMFVKSTPTLILNGRKIIVHRSFDEIAKLIEAEIH